MSGVDLLNRYVDSRDLCRGTVAWLTMIVARFARYNGGAIDADHFRAEIVSAWLTSMVSEGALSRTTIKDYRRGLLILWRWGYDQGHLPHPPLGVKPIKAPLPVPRGWSAAQVNLLLEHAAKMKGSYRCGVPRALFFAALIRAAWDSGLRLSDLLRLTTSHYNTDGYGAIVQGKVGHPVMFRLRHTTLAAIDAIRPNSREFIFGGVVSRTKFFRALKRMTTAAGLSGGLKRIRKGGASSVERFQPGHGRRYLGHKSSGIAERYYLDPTIIGQEPPMPPELA